ncbi:MAG: hypothetical protein EOO03_12645 [Chitinophagaceae bacterium]|nr:MAG: hypothetical protein EOO03_12645 [Chitinophagaceae bacterium]
MQWLKDKTFLVFVAKFLVLFCLFYYGTIAWIGIAAPGGTYSPFVERWLDYVSWIKQSLVAGTGWLVGLFGYDTVKEPGFLIRIVGKRGVFIAMDCVGYGVYSFWAAYVLANSGTLVRKLAWVFGGIFLLWCINVVRISMFLVAINKNKTMPLGIDHHTWFTIVAYGFIFGMIYFYDKYNREYKKI